MTLEVFDQADPQEELQTSAKRDWHTAAADWCRAQAGKSVSEATKRQELFRKKAYEWLLASNHALEIMFGRGWKSFVVGEGCTDEAAAWPCITCALDQGSDGWSAVHYLQHCKVNMLIVNDASHRVWNDCQLALKDSGCWGLCLVGLVLLNLDHGPWEGAKWHQESQQAALEYGRLANSECPLFLSHLPQICQETGRRLADLTPEVAGCIWEALPDSVQTKLPKVGFSRWFGFFDSMTKLTEVWSQRLLFYQYICIQLGSALNKHREKVVVALEQRNEQEDVLKSTTKNDRDEVRKARAACKNTLEFAALVMSDRCFWIVCRGLSLLSRVVREWHTEQNKANRSCEESVSWMVQMASGGGTASCAGTLQLLQSSGFLEDLGMPTTAFPAGVSSVHAEHPLVVEERELVGKLADYALCLCMRRLRSLSWHTDTYPGMFALLLSQDQAGVDHALKTMREDWDCWQVLRQQKGPFWKKLQQRSPFCTVHTEQIFRMLRESNWQVTPSIVQTVQRQFAAVTQTKIVEDSVRVGRVAETNKGMSKQVGPAEVWSQLCFAELADKVHRFRQPAWKAEVVPDGLSTTSVSGFYKPVPKEAWKELRGVASNRRTPTWYSPSPIASAAPAEDLALLRHCKQSDAWTAAKNSWSSSLVNVPRLCLRHRGQIGSPWFYSLGSVGGSAVAGWPMESLSVESQTFLTPKCTGGKFWLYLLDPSEWEAMPISWCGPLELKARSGHFPDSCFVVARSMQPPLPLLQCAARCAFWSHSKVTLLTVAKQLGLAASSDLALSGVLEARPVRRNII